MIFIETKIKSIDNTGIVLGKCIHIYGNSQRKTSARLGKKILISIRKRKNTKLVTKEKMLTAVIVCSSYPFKRLNNHFYKFDENKFLSLPSDNNLQNLVAHTALPSEIFFNNFKETTFLSNAVF
jgi:ribosomal protein L14